jgi:hypothetical protein
MNEEILNSVCAHVLAVFVERFKIDKEKLKFEDELKDVTNNNLNETGHALMDLHQMLEVEIDYSPFDVYDKFITIEDVAKYFYIALASREEE